MPGSIRKGLEALSYIKNSIQTLSQKVGVVTMDTVVRDIKEGLREA
jgi:hypothetical protein